MPNIVDFIGDRRKIALYGEMGAGKTTFVKAFCQQLGVQGATASPTFSLINEYAYSDATGAPSIIHHLDLYRLKNAEEAYDIGVEEVLFDPFYALIEWPQIVESLLPDEIVKISIEITGATSRKLVIL